MGKQVAQGTRLESEIVTKIRATGRRVSRQPKLAQKHEPDVMVDGWGSTIPVVWWKNYYRTPGKKNRRSETMVVLRENDFLKLLDLDVTEQYAILVQAKATQNLPVRATLVGLAEWMGRHGSVHDSNG